MNMNDVRVYGYENATIALGNEPLLSIHGPLAHVQLIETAFLNLTNYPTLITSLTAKIRSFASNLIENGSISSQLSTLMGLKYAYIGGINKTSNVQASELFGIDLFYESPSFDNSGVEYLEEDFMYNGVNIVEKFRSIDPEIYFRNEEKIKFTVYSNIDNEYFTLEYENEDDRRIVIILTQIFKPGDLIIKQSEYNNNKLSTEDDYELFSHNLLIRYVPNMLISKKTNIKNLLLGPDYIVSCTQPALGMVYKIMEINDKPCIKFSEEKSKQSIPGFKKVLRLYNGEDFIGDYLHYPQEEPENQGPGTNTLKS